MSVCVDFVPSVYQVCTFYLLLVPLTKTNQNFTPDPSYFGFNLVPISHLSLFAYCSSLIHALISYQTCPVCADSSVCSSLYRRTRLYNIRASPNAKWVQNEQHIEYYWRWYRSSYKWPAYWYRNLQQGFHSRLCKVAGRGLHKLPLAGKEMPDLLFARWVLPMSCGHHYAIGNGYAVWTYYIMIHHLLSYGHRIRACLASKSPRMYFKFVKQVRSGRQSNSNPIPISSNQCIPCT